MKKVIFTLLMIFEVMYLHGQNISRQQADSMLKSLKTDKRDTARIRTFLKLAEFNIFKPGEFKIDLDSAEIFIDKANQLNTTIKSRSLEGYSTLLAAYLSKERKNFHVPKALVEKSINILKSTDDKFHLALAYVELSKYDGSNDPFQQDSRTLVKNELSKLVKDHKIAGSCQVNAALSGLFQQDGDYKQALFYALQTLSSVKSAADSLALGGYYVQISNLYLTLNMKEECIGALKKYLSVLASQKRMAEIPMAIKQIAALKMMQGKPQEGLDFLMAEERKYPLTDIKSKKLMAQGKAQCYAALKKYPIAERYFSEMINLSNLQIRRGEIKSDFASDYFMGLFYIRTEQYKKAKIYLDKALSEVGYPETKTSDAVRKIYISLFKVDSASGNYISAIRRLQFNQNLKDSVFDIAKNKQIEALQVAYKTAQKERDISVLQDEAKTQKIKLQHAETTRNWIISGSIMLLLLLTASYNRYLLKKKNNKVISDKNQLLQHLLKEKEWLLKEVHHRVKNNLHTVICLLESQAAYLENDALKAIETSQHRIFAMSLIHQKLYQSEDIKTINMAVHLAEFVSYLSDSFGIQNKIRFQFGVEPLQLGVSQSVPIVLIINEAVTNSIKYAFPGEKKGIISIFLNKIGDEIRLLIKDDGIGFEHSTENMPSPSLGLKLMRGLSEDINATISFENDHGTKIVVVFSIDRLHESNNLVASLSDGNSLYES